MNTSVNSEIAKLLKEKGFDEQSLTIYQDGEILFLKSTISNSQFLTSRNYTAPTISEVVMWLYEKHGIWVTVRINASDKTFQYSIHNVNTMKGSLDNIECAGFILPTEAYTAAIKYTLENLIK